MPQDVCIAGMVQKRSICTIFGPRIARIEELSSVPCQLLISPRVGYSPSRIVPKGPSSWVHPARSYFNLVNMDHLSLQLCGFIQVLY